MSRLALKRVYEAPSPDDGFRVLVDRIWPRGVSKQAARLDLWLKDVGPSTALRQWFGHRPDRWEEFRARYHAELDARPGPFEELRAAVAGRDATLLFGAKDKVRNQAVVLRERLRD